MFGWREASELRGRDVALCRWLSLFVHLFRSLVHQSRIQKVTCR